MAKRFFVRAALCLGAAAVLAGCGGVSAQEYSALQEERDQLLAQNAQLEQDYEALREEYDALLAEEEPREMVISGTFTATVRSLMPNYVLDDFSPLTAVVTQFQDSPFTLNLREEVASQLQPGDSYVFTVEEKRVEMLLDADGRILLPTPETAIPLYNLQIISAVRAEKEDLGMVCSHLTAVPVD